MRRALSTVRGEVPILVDDSAADTVVVLAHGAGSHMEHPTLEWLASIVRQSGAAVVRFNFLYRASGRSMPDRMPVLIDTYRSVVAAVHEESPSSLLVVGGHSMGGRVASMMEAEERSADGLLLFGYPLHPPGQHDKLRYEHLPLVQTPTLQINGTRDDFCVRPLMESVLESLDANTWRMHWVDGANHSYAVSKASGRSRGDVRVEVQDAVSEWLGSLEKRVRYEVPNPASG